MLSFLRARRIKASSETVVESFPYPLAPCPRIAVSKPHDTNPIVDLAKYETLAAPMNTIRALAPSSWAPQYPLVVFSSVHEALMTDADRDYIWHTFRVPAFEYLLDGGGEIIARECEAHEGLHLDRAPESLGRATVTEQPCDCGQSGVRLMTLATGEGANVII